MKGLLERASIELDEPFSWHPARRADSLARSNPHPLRSAGEANFTECCPLTNFAGIALALTDVCRTMFCEGMVHQKPGKCHVASGLQVAPVVTTEA